MFSLVFFLSFNQYKQVYYQKGEVVSLCSTLLTTSNNINTRWAKRILRNYKIHLSSRLSSCSIEKRTEINGVFCYHYEETYKPIFNRIFFWSLYRCEYIWLQRKKCFAYCDSSSVGIVPGVLYTIFSSKCKISAVLHV